LSEYKKQPAAGVDVVLPSSLCGLVTLYSVDLNALESDIW